jgi:hypothetical protein
MTKQFDKKTALFFTASLFSLVVSILLHLEYEKEGSLFTGHITNTFIAGFFGDYALVIFHGVAAFLFLFMGLKRLVEKKSNV